MDDRRELEKKHPNGQWISGYFVEDGALYGVNLKEVRSSEYAQKVGPYGFYVPSFVTKIAIEDNTFNLAGGFVDEWVMTDSVRCFVDDNFDMCGFFRFVILDQETGEVIFETDRFVDENQKNWLGGIPAFARFEKELNKDPDKFYADRKAGIPFFKPRKAKAAPQPPKLDPNCIYRRFSSLECARHLPLFLGKNRMIKKKIKVMDEKTGKEYTVSFTTKEKSMTSGYRSYDLYEAAEHYIGGSKGDKVIDVEKATEIPRDSRYEYQNTWENILVAVSDDAVLKDIVELAQKNAEGEFTKNRIVRIACEGTVTEKGEIMQLIAKPKDETTLEVYPKARPFSPNELANIEQDYFAKHPDLVRR